MAVLSPEEIESCEEHGQAVVRAAVPARQQPRAELSAPGRRLLGLDRW